MKLIQFCFVCFLLISMPLHAGISQQDPKRMISELSEQILAEIDRNRDVLLNDPAEVKAFADKFVLPYVDTPKMARYVMGQFWKQASADQQSSFSNAFTDSLLKAYSGSVLKLDISEIKVLKSDESRKGRASVDTEAIQKDGNVSKVVYRLYFNKKIQKWMLYDVSIEGVSLLLNYRKTFASEFDKKGIDQVITDLQRKNQAVLEKQGDVKE